MVARARNEITKKIMMRMTKKIMKTTREVAVVTEGQDRVDISARQTMTMKIMMKRITTRKMMKMKRIIEGEAEVIASKAGVHGGDLVV